MYGDFSAHATVRLDVQLGASLAPESYPESSHRSRQKQLLRPILIDGSESSELVAGSRCLCLEIGDPQPQLLDDLPISSDFEQAAAPGGHRSEVGSVGHEMLPCTSSPLSRSENRRSAQTFVSVQVAPERKQQINSAELSIYT